MSTRTPGLFADSPGARTNRIRSILIRFGIRTFKVKLRQASKHLEELRGDRRGECRRVLINTDTTGASNTGCSVSTAEPLARKVLLNWQ
jgi:hypothetical protein